MASTDIAFSPSVKAVQERRGSRGAYARLEQNGGWETKIDGVLAKFIAGLRSFYLATASKDGQPYVQHRGGPPGFLRVIDETTLAFADFAGNRQYISTGNLAENPRGMLFLMDYQNRRRVKIWGQARVIENDPQLIARLFPDDYRARPRPRSCSPSRRGMRTVRNTSRKCCSSRMSLPQSMCSRNASPPSKRRMLGFAVRLTEAVHGFVSSRSWN